MISDATFRIGSSHTICEDYARAGVSIFGDPIAIVSDGCSSSPDTDIGSRILVLEILKNSFLTEDLEAVTTSLQHTRAPSLCIEECDNIRLYKYSMNSAKQSICAMGLDEKCLDATILILMATQNKIISTCWGDGIIVQKFKSGTISARIISYPNGYPSYPSYILEPLREHNRKHMNKITKKTITRTPDGKTYINDIPTYDTPLDITVTHFDEHNNDPLVAMAIFSDGIQSFTRTNNEETSKTKKPVDFIELLPKLMSFSGKGEFTRRRLNGLIRKEPELSHYDDLSIGAIII